ncbi:MAG: alpha/beta hydrolase [Microbacteriaceae bacterium]|jgi:pimeloyl-ACP methyl ester carboxylesterase|nr:alpha/beta hydrolase [Microbacteriaceae bacterium]
MTETAQSADGTTIAYERAGVGQPLIILGGAFNHRHSADVLKDLLAPYYAVYVPDRRGRGDSGDTQPYSVEREIEDLDAVISAAGGSAYVYGHSSGAILALEAASSGSAITKLAAYEPPYTADPDDPTPLSDGGVQAAIDAGERARAAEGFLRLTGMDENSIQWVKQAAFWPGMVAMAHTLPYDLALTGDGEVPAERLAGIAVPTLIMDGGTSAAWAGRAAASIVAAIPGARRLTVEGQDHGVDQTVLAPLLIEFFG